MLYSTADDYKSQRQTKRVVFGVVNRQQQTPQALFYYPYWRQNISVLRGENVGIRNHIRRISLFFYCFYFLLYNTVVLFFLLFLFFLFFLFFFMTLSLQIICNRKTCIFKITFKIMNNPLITNFNTFKYKQLLTKYKCFISLIQYYSYYFSFM